MAIVIKPRPWWACRLFSGGPWFFADVLANLEIAQLPYDGRANNHSHKSAEAGKCGPK